MYTAIKAENQETADQCVDERGSKEKMTSFPLNEKGAKKKKKKGDEGRRSES